MMLMMRVLCVVAAPSFIDGGGNSSNRSKTGSKQSASKSGGIHDGSSNRPTLSGWQIEKNIEIANEANKSKTKPLGAHLLLNSEAYVAVTAGCAWLLCARTPNFLKSLQERSVK